MLKYLQLDKYNLRTDGTFQKYVYQPTKIYIWAIEILGDARFRHKTNEPFQSLGKSIQINQEPRPIRIPNYCNDCKQEGYEGQTMP